MLPLCLGPGRGLVPPYSTFCAQLACNISSLARAAAANSAPSSSPGLGGDCDLRAGDILRDLSDGQAEWLAREVFAPAFRDRPGQHGTFLEFGSKDGRYQSNSFLFEAAFGWSGILVDIGREYMAPLRQLRSCRARGASGACVWAALGSSALGEASVVVEADANLILPRDHPHAAALLAKEGSYEVGAQLADGISWGHAAASLRRHNNNKSNNDNKNNNRCRCGGWTES